MFKLTRWNGSKISGSIPQEIGDMAVILARELSNALKKEFGSK